MKYENITYENTVILMLGQINNRLAEIAATLQITGLLDAAKEDSERQKWYDELKQLLQAQGEAIATMEIIKA